MAAAAPFVIMGVGMAASAAASVASSVSANKTAQKNYELQKEQYEYEKNLQSQIMDREDNAIQRQVADSRAAGISPLYQMAGAQSSGAAGVAVNTPQKEQTPSTMATALQGVGMLSSLVQAYAQFKGVQTDNAQKALDLQEAQSTSDDRMQLIADAASMSRMRNDEYRSQMKRTSEMHDLSKRMQELMYKNASREFDHKVDAGIYDTDDSRVRSMRGLMSDFYESADNVMKDKSEYDSIESLLLDAIKNAIKNSLNPFAGAASGIKAITGKKKSK